MDLDIQAALRLLGRTFHTGGFTTVELLRHLNIKKLYLVSGIFDGLFFSLEDLSKCIKHHEFFGHINSPEASAVEAWINNQNREPSFSLNIQQFKDWDGPLINHLSVVNIATLELDKTPDGCCYNNSFISQMSAFLSPIKCPNNECNCKPCVSHLVECHHCGKQGCLCCSQVIDEDGTSDGIVCQKCADDFNQRKDE